MPMKFNEFLKEKAKVDQMADYSGPLATKPPENAKYPAAPKGAGTKLPYKGKGEDPGLETADTDSKPGFGSMPHPGMTPEKVMPKGKAPARAVKHVPTPKKLREFYETTKGMSDNEFVAYLLEQRNERPQTAFVHDLHGEPFTPHPHETMTYIASLMHNPKMVSRMIREVKRHGRLSEMVQELMDHPEFYSEAVKCMDHEEEGPNRAGKFARALHDHGADFKKKAGINEGVAPELVDDGPDEATAAEIMPQPAGPADQSQEEPDMPAPDQGDMGINMGGGGMRPMADDHLIGSMAAFAPMKAKMMKACQDGNC